ncbi:hypothetical protein GMLC_12140 [Geomonas limicola]|uniref:Ice-binding protein C-terminal domain-containing protein n=1 Tax=Geomonas limicola TaxID=2740186 RepID=A0A6V8N502_9BACT|nr:PEP-CTERM sorting domain-containing protein [Geomonas limicola]GFO67635.1 hypothetical protein GMLC_12140 [Geomonas limicola]
MKGLLKKTALATVLACSLGAVEAYAVPGLGVGTDAGYVNAKDAYQTYWGPSYSSSTVKDGFIIGASGSQLHVWSQYANADIYVLTTADVKAGNNITFNGSIFEYADTGTFASYSPTPYYGLDLGKVGAGWSALTAPPFNPGGFYSMDVTVNYTGDIGDNQWIFAAADNNGVAGLQAKGGSFYTDDNGLEGIQEQDTTIWMDTNSIAGIQKKDGKVKINGNWVTYLADTKTIYDADTFTQYQGDPFSPKTTAANGFTPVPEPGTLLLLGGGFAGLAVLSKRRKNR